jgi:hypothetical protein
MSEKDQGFEVFNQRLITLHEDVGGIKDALKQLTDAITRLALIEQSQAQAAKAQERIFGVIEKLEGRVSVVEQKLPDAARATIWVDRVLWAAASAIAVFILKKEGLL